MAPASKRSGKTVAAPRPVESLIHVIRGQKVMLDSNLAELCAVSIKVNQAVKRHAAEFPEGDLLTGCADSMRAGSPVSRSGAGWGSVPASRQVTNKMEYLERETRPAARPPALLRAFGPRARAAMMEAALCPKKLF